uniref:VanZ family protein n=1 Tax=Bacteroides acidifaciens TaxID=85831 RepID=UPI0025861BB3
PFGVFIQLLWETVSVKKFFVIDFLVIMIIETIQPFIGRSFDSNDIILNIFGSLLGFGMASLLNKYVPKFVSVFRYQRH